MAARLLDTARLALRPVAAADHAALQTLFTQPGVRRFLFDDEVLSAGQTTAIIEKSRRLFEEIGGGLWLAESRHVASPGEPVGFGGFWYFREPPELELLFGVADRRLEQGYGREIARAMVAYGFDTLQMPVVRASTDAGHTASRRLLEDLGFRLVREDVVDDLATAFYELEP